MAQYKVPQDVEAEDKLIGPFSFRQFVYLLIAAGLIALAVGLFQIFPLLAIIPVLPALLFLVLALPLKKDQPMETYLAAIVSYYLKPHARLWAPGQKESTILITAPKVVEQVRTRDISQEEATHRLSFLADIVDTGGYAIKGASANPMREDLFAEANAMQDMFDEYKTVNISRAINADTAARHEEAVREMQAAIKKNESKTLQAVTEAAEPSQIQPGDRKEVVVAPAGAKKTNAEADEKPAPVVEKKAAQAKTQEKDSPTSPKPSIIELANNSDFSVATIAKEANRLKRKDEGEVFISLH